MYIKNLKQHSVACPTIFDFQEVESSTNYYFRLQHGSASIVNEDTGAIILEGIMPGFDGVCTWEQAMIWMEESGLTLTGKFKTYT